jgi:ribonuclease HII
VGRGCLAGPVVAAAVVLKDVNQKKWFHQVRDSKQLLPKKRTELATIIRENAWYGIGMVEEKIIDEINIHNASLLAMRRAVESLFGAIPAQGPEPKIKNSRLRRSDAYFLFLDGKFTIPSFDMQQEAVVEGDGKILSVAAASIVAKVFRDELMEKYHQKYPLYNFAQHKGYATFHHRKMISEHGLSAIPRLFFCVNICVS